MVKKIVKIYDLKKSWITRLVLNIKWTLIWRVVMMRVVLTVKLNISSCLHGERTPGFFYLGNQKPLYTWDDNFFPWCKALNFQVTVGRMYGTWNCMEFIQLNVGDMFIAWRLIQKCRLAGINKIEIRKRKLIFLYDIVSVTFHNFFHFCYTLYVFVIWDEYKINYTFKLKGELRWR